MWPVMFPDTARTRTEEMRRALLTWRGAAPEVTVVPTPVPSSQFYAHSTGASFEQIRGILQEYAAIVAYWLRGWFSSNN